MSWGSRSSADTGEVWMTLPSTMAATTIQNTQASRRVIRNLVQSDIRRCVVRSKPPKKETVQNRW